MPVPLLEAFCFCFSLLFSLYVNLSMPTELAIAGVDNLDRARVLADFWAEHNLYCPNCSSEKLTRADSPAGEFSCPDCRSRFQIKGQPTRFGKSVVGGEFDSVTRAMGNGKTSGYFFLHYDARSWTVRDLLLVPRLAIPDAAIARRAASCHFVLDRIPAEARIAMIITIKSDSPGGTECIMISRAEEVREKFRRLGPRKGKGDRTAA
jgi:DNA-directed RNA polymerase subunit RPC12/RpoP